MILFLFFIIYLLSYSVDNVNHRDFLIMYAWLNNLLQDIASNYYYYCY